MADTPCVSRIFTFPLFTVITTRSVHAGTVQSDIKAAGAGAVLNVGHGRVLSSPLLCFVFSSHFDSSGSALLHLLVEMFCPRRAESRSSWFEVQPWWSRLFTAFHGCFTEKLNLIALFDLFV